MYMCWFTSCRNELRPCDTCLHLHTVTQGPTDTCTPLSPPAPSPRDHPLRARAANCTAAPESSRLPRLPDDGPSDRHPPKVAPAGCCAQLIGCQFFNCICARLHFRTPLEFLKKYTLTYSCVQTHDLFMHWCLTRESNPSLLLHHSSTQWWPMPIPFFEHTYVYLYTNIIYTYVRVAIVLTCFNHPFLCKAIWSVLQTFCLINWLVAFTQTYTCYMSHVMSRAKVQQMVVVEMFHTQGTLPSMWPKVSWAQPDAEAARLTAKSWVDYFEGRTW